MRWAALLLVPQIAAAQVSPTALPARISGSINHAGRTTTPTTQAFGALTVGTRASYVNVVSDPISGPAQINDECDVVLTNGAIPPSGMAAPICSITAAGQATVVFQAIAAVLAGSVTYNIFWRG